MNAKDVLMTQYGLLYKVVGANVTGLSQDDSIKQPEPGGNCSNWILGHLIGSHNRALELLGEEPVWADESLARARKEPITGDDDAIEWDTMRDRFLGSQDRCLAAIERLTDEELDEGGFSDSFGQECTRGEYLSLLVFHGNYHAGQLGLSRRLAGHPGVIGSPKAQAQGA